METEVDEALSKLGRYGRWQMSMYVLACTSSFFPACWHMIMFVFVAWTPPHHCTPPDGATVKEAVPMVTEDGVSSPSTCSMYQYDNTNTSRPPIFLNKTMDCDRGWTYDLEFPDQATIVTDMGLVCERAALPELTQTIFVIGVMVGAIVFSVLADKLGRKTVHLGCLWTVGVIGALSALSNDYVSYSVLRFVLGFLQMGMVGTGVTLAIEIFPVSQRTFAGTFIQIFWVIAHFLLTLFGYLIHDWRYLQVLVCLAGFLTIPYYWILPEAVPWLAANGRKDQAEEIIQKAAKINKLTIPSPVLMAADQDLPPDGDTSQLASERDEGLVARIKRLFWCCGKKSTDAEKYQYTMLDIIRHRRLRWNVLNMCFQWLVANTVYYGLILSTNELVGNRYLNFFISGAVELPAYVLCVFVLLKGRRIPLVVFNMVAGVSLGAVIIVQETTAIGEVRSGLIIALTNIGKFAITATFCVVVLYVSEIAPTNLRTMTAGLASASGRLGGVIAPFSSYAGRQIAWLPNAVFCVLGIAAALLALLLPETVDKPLPQTMEDIEAWYEQDVDTGDEQTDTPDTTPANEGSAYDKTTDSSNTPAADTAL